MRIIKLMPKANEDLEGIWYYSYHHFGEPQADRYVEHLSDVLQILSNNNIGTPRPELGEGILFFLLNATSFISCNHQGKLSSFVSLTKPGRHQTFTLELNPPIALQCPPLKWGHSPNRFIR